MARSSGTYTAPVNSVNPAVSGTAILSADFNEFLDDVETALTESVYTAGLGSTDNALVRTDGTDTKKAQGSSVTLSDAGVLGSARVTPTGASGTRTLEAMLGDIKNAKDWGVTLDGSTDDRTAMQALVDYVVTNSTVTEGPVGAILVPAGGILKLGSSLNLTKPLVFICQSFIHYTGTSGAAIVVQSAAPSAGANTGWYVYLAGGRCMAANKNTAAPTSINASGGSFLEIRNAQFGTFKVGDVIAFPKYGIWGNCSNDQYTGQHIQDVRIEVFGQIAYCGAGIYCESVSAADGAFQVNHIIGSNPFTNFKNLVLGPSGDTNTNHNIVDLFAMDNQSGEAGSRSIDVYGSYNDLRIPYFGTTGHLTWGTGSVNNRAVVLMPQSVGWSITDSGTGNMVLFPQSDGWVEAQTNKTHTGKVTVNGGISTPVGALTLANGANSDITLPASEFARVAGPTGAFNVTGFAGGESGRRLTLFNSTSQDMTITNDATSTAANRILTLTGSDVALTGTSVARFIYSSDDSRWILLGTQG